MLVPVRNMAGEVVGETELRDDIFGAPVSKALMHQALVRQLANARLGTHKAKTRGEVRGSTRKIWRQKGTGRARHGSMKVNLWPGGGVAHGPLPRSYEKKMPRKMRRAAYRSALSVKAQEEQIVVLDALEMGTPRTREIVGLIERLNLEGSVLIMLPEKNEGVERSARNLPDVKTVRASYLNIRDLLGYDYLLIPQGSVKVIEDILG
ncbi:MAG: 50S ribosomal protein L4 [Anaerolineae bacterium]|nr:50S ribosomal protein L4 [Anaerolineae bacterium]